MERINLYLASGMDYKRGLAHRLLDKGIVDFCLADFLPWDSAPPYRDNIVTVDYSPSLRGEYEDVCKLQELPALSKDLMEAMLPYESMAIRLGIRRYHVPTVEYEKERERYLHHLRYWNYMFEKYQINIVFFGMIPHNQGKYIAYCLAKEKGIQVLILTRLLDLNRCVFGNSIESIGSAIEKEYKKLGSSYGDEKLDDDLYEKYEAMCMPKMEAFAKTASSTRKIWFFMFDNNYRNLKKKYRRMHTVYLIKKLLGIKGEGYKNSDIWYAHFKRELESYAYFRKRLSITLKDYNRMAEEADYTKRFICFFPQITPEATTMPLAGVFAEQYNSIQLLAKAAEQLGVYVYVREHPHLAYRAKDFYEEIRSISNIKLVKSTVSPYELMAHSVAVATQSGTCILESITQGKPCVVFGSGNVFKGAPGVYEMTSENQGTSLIKKLLEGIEIPRDDVKKYFYALQKGTVREISVEAEDKYTFSGDPAFVAIDDSDRVDLIEEFINSLR